MAFYLTGCQTEQVETNSASVSTEVHSEENETESGSIEALDLTELEQERVAFILSDFAFDDMSENTYEQGMDFNQLMEKMEEISEENAYAKEFVDNAKKIKYDELEEKCRLIFDVYVKLLFRESAYTAKVSSDLLGTVDECWYGEYEAGDVTDFFLRFTGYPKLV